MTYNNYFKLRNINENFYKNYKVPKYILKIIKDNNIKKILDFGCGIGQLVKSTQRKKYRHCWHG